MRLLFRVREREHAAVICLPRLRKVTSSGSRNLPVAQPGTDVMRDVLRLVDVDLLQNCNGRSTIAQADDLLKRVVRHGGLLIRHDELPSRVAALRGGVRGLPPQESEGDIRQSAVLVLQAARIGVSVFRQWILVVDVPWHQSVGRQWTRHRPKGPSHSPPSHHHPPSAVPDILMKKRGQA